MAKKIALAPIGSSGDVRPLVALGLKLRERGDSVSFCAPPNFENYIRGFGFNYHPVGHDIQAIITKFANEFMGNPLSGIWQTLKFGLEMIDTQYEHLLYAVKGADLLIGGGLIFTGKTVTEVLGIPFTSVCHIPLMLKSAYYPPLLTPWQNLPNFINRVLWVGYEQTMCHLFCGKLNIIRKNAGLENIENPLMLGLDNLIVAMDKELCPMPPDINFPYIQTGYWNLFDETPLPQNLEEFLSAGSAPVYIGFGSMTDPAPGKTVRIITEALEHADARAVVLKGWAGLGSGLESNRIFLADTVSHTKLFPRMKVIVHHGGAGTSWAAGYSGVPQVLVPHWGDQFFWAHRFSKMKLCPAALPRSTVNAKRLADAIQEAASSKEIINRCVTMKNKLGMRNGIDETIGQFDSLF